MKNSEEGSRSVAVLSQVSKLKKWLVLLVLTVGVITLALGLPLKDYYCQVVDFLTIARLVEDLSETAENKLLEELFYRLRKTVKNADGTSYRPLQYVAEIIEHGYVSCDQAAWLFSEMCWHKGIPSHVLYLFRPEEENSCHTVVCVYVDNKWRIIDTSEDELMWDENGDLPSLTEIISGNVKVEESYRRLFIKHRLADHGVNKFYQLLFVLRYGFIPEKYHYDYGPSGTECLTRRQDHFLTLRELLCD